MQISDLKQGGLIALSVLATFGVLLVYVLAASRVFLPLAPAWLARVSPKHGTPNRMTLAVGLATAASAAALPFDFLISMTNEANLFFFAVVCLAVPILRLAAPDAPRAFRAPGGAWVPVAAALACVGLMASFAWRIHVGFVAWLGLGVTLYALVGVTRRTSSG